ncbi:OLC1v1012977C2 [Oldenlandia corymbosa var. corymbosa]|uniref:OLC1v1012977C2 n=1 Tax=Oldenlandia corymbosa var. corymbosa TaxID=529605 RepID=A0AAV1DZ77_OLDCO|nr:OLC1v1012977C2 [Oldenlandia corymbosa var. corymbosa]
MILPGRSRICRVSIAPFSLGYFVKHHPTSPSRPFFSFTFKFNSNGRKPQSFTTTATRETSLLHTLTSTQQQQVELYIHSLLQWNQKMNLTAVKDENEAMERHVEDSLAIIEPITSSYLSHCGTSCENLNLIDVGTGAGLPGVILAIACPGWKLTLLESMRKRCDFLEHAVSVTGLSNVQVIRERAEEEVKRAERAIKLMGASLLPTFTVKSHSKLGQRTAIVCLKEGSTPKKYPRDPGIPGKLPL